MTGAERKTNFIDSTIAMVAKVGMENLRTKQIAEAVGLSEASMFRYFGSKEEILREAFFVVDKRVSALLSGSRHIDELKTESIIDVAYKIWLDVYHYLLEHRDETLFLIRYRYSAYYTDEVRSQRQAYSGAFDYAYDLLEAQFGTPDATYRGFAINYIFELTLCFAEKIVTGRVKESKDLESRLWGSIKGALGSLILSSKQV